MIISVLNQKGGVGKTTLGIHLAIALPLLYPEGMTSLLVDADPQGSSRDWNALAQGKWVNTIALDRPSIGEDVLPHAKRYDFVIIDGPSKLDQMEIAIIKCSDIVLIPTKTSSLELWASEPMYELIQARFELKGKPHSATVICQKIRNTNCSKAIREELKNNNIRLFNSGTTNRVSYIESLSAGKSVLNMKDETAKQEIMSIAQELKELINEIR
jgi:chromosome partitioning protein